MQIEIVLIFIFNGFFPENPYISEKQADISAFHKKRLAPMLMKSAIKAASRLLKRISISRSKETKRAAVLKKVRKCSGHWPICRTGGNKQI